MISLAPPVDLDQFRPGTERPDRPRCIAVGRMVRQKGFDTLLRAWPRAVRSAPGAELVLVGDGPQASKLRRLAERLQVADSVRFTGRLSRSEVAALLRTATVFALPVRTRLGGLNPEGLGLGFLEAAASGLPVIVGRSGGAPETVRDGETGLVVEPDDVDGLTRVIGDLLTDPGRAAAMGRAGRDLVRERFSSEVVAATLRAVL
jgi:phosphatidylinositol alpha-1,6-mannosyltransferase